MRAGLRVKPAPSSEWALHLGGSSGVERHQTEAILIPHSFLDVLVETALHMRIWPLKARTAATLAKRLHYGKNMQYGGDRASDGELDC